MPFAACMTADSFYPSDAHHGALLKLRYAIENRRGAALLCGASGTGKTLVSNLLSQHLAAEFLPLVHVVFPSMPAAELLNFLANELEADAGRTDTLRIDESVWRIQNRLRENFDRGKHTVIVVDEAHLLAGTDGLEALRLLMNFETDQASLATILLIGQSTLIPALDRMPQLEERLAVKCMLQPLTLEQTISYISARLTAAGAVGQIFTIDALEAIFHATQGNPRRINRLCDLSLLIGFAEEQPTIGQAQIEAVAEELVAVAAD